MVRDTRRLHCDNKSTLDQSLMSSLTAIVDRRTLQCDRGTSHLSAIMLSGHSIGVGFDQNVSKNVLLHGISHFEKKSEISCTIDAHNFTF